jgi:hypothetical protein
MEGWMEGKDGWKGWDGRKDGWEEFAASRTNLG